MSKTEKDEYLDLLRKGCSSLWGLTKYLMDECKYFEHNVYDLDEDVSKVQEGGEEGLNTSLSASLAFLGLSAYRILGAAKAIEDITRQMDEAHGQTEGVADE